MKRILAFVLLCLLLCGCETGLNKRPQTESKIVVKTTIGRMVADADPLRSYGDEETIGEILRYLDQLKPGDVADAPVFEDRDIWTITLHYADGRKKCYYLHDDGYLKEGDEEWRVLETLPETTLREFIRNNQDTTNEQQSNQIPSEDTESDFMHKIP